MNHKIPGKVVNKRENKKKKENEHQKKDEIPLLIQRRIGIRQENLYLRNGNG